MILYPNSKINIGLNILSRRDDGYHDISSVYYPVCYYFDILEIIRSNKFKFSSSGINIPGKENIVEKAFRLLQDNFNIPAVNIHLHKNIPIGAGLGGGSSDAAFTLKALNSLYGLELSQLELEKYALILGADVPFFIENTPKYVQGIGESMSCLNLDLSEYTIRFINPGIHISTAKAYAKIFPAHPKKSLKELIKHPVKKWRENIINDFEASVFQDFPELDVLKQDLYSQGAVYASLTGSGSVLFGIFKKFD